MDAPETPDPCRREGPAARALRRQHMQLRKTNRITSRTPKKRLFWCDCDHSHIGQSGKCSLCGRTRKGAKDKKPGPTE